MHKRDHMKHAPFHYSGVTFDTMIAAYLLAPGDRRFGLGELSVKYLNEHMLSYSDLVKDEKEKAQPLSAVDFEKVSHYACHDADVTFRLEEKLSKLLKKEDLWKVFSEIEMPLLPVLERMERRGVLLDEKHFASMQTQVAKELKTLETKI